MRVALAALVVAGCASGRSADVVDADPGKPPVDAKVWLDGQIEPQPDAPNVIPVDAAVDARPDAYVCQPMTQQLLMNPVLDLNPSGMGWVQVNIDNAFPVVTGDGNFNEHSAPFKAWMGGWTGEQKGVSSVSDTLYQDITVPAGTTQLVLTGYYHVETSETGSTVYDTGQLALVQTNGTPLQVVKSLSNTTPTTGWTAINHTFSSPYAGQTVRLRMTSSNDFDFVSNFYFDTLALTATVCN